MSTGPDASEVSGLLRLAEAVAREAGAQVQQRRDAVARMSVSGTKTSHTDVVTQSDVMAEVLIRQRLAAARPGDAVLGEEGGLTRGTTGLTWVIDPIDGTVNYLYGIPAYAVSVAVAFEDAGTSRVFAGCVHNPASGETWTAGRGGGARRDGHPIEVSGCRDLAQALVGTGFGYDARRRSRQAKILDVILPTVRDIRRIGAASLDLCSVADGRLDGYYERGLKPWDLAAGGLIAEEAGALVTGAQDRPAGEDLVVAATPGVHARLREILTELGADADEPWT